MHSQEVEALGLEPRSAAPKSPKLDPSLSTPCTRPVPSAIAAWCGWSAGRDLCLEQGRIGRWARQEAPWMEGSRAGYVHGWGRGVPEGAVGDDSVFPGSYSELGSSAGEAVSFLS